MTVGFTGNAGMLQERGRDTLLGFLIPDLPLQNVRTGAAPLTASTTVLVAAILPVTGSTQTFTIAAQPDVCRAVTMTITDADASIQKITATIRGTDFWGNSISEILIGTSAASFTTSLAFFSITSITAVTVGTPVGADRASFGTATALGLPARLRAEADIIAKRVDGTQDTTGVVTINADGSATWVPASVPNNTRKYYCTIASRYNVPS